jgi:hypothetical protein
MADLGGTMASASAAVSIGNYKGVMLCNRPFNGVSTSAFGLISLVPAASQF